MRLRFSRHARVRGPHSGSHRRGRPRGALRRHAARPAAGTRPATDRLARERSGAAPGPAGLSARAHPPAGSGRSICGTRSRTPWWWSATARSFRKPSSIFRRTASSTCMLRCCRNIAARARPVGHRQRRDAHRRHHHADRCRARHRRHAAESGNRNRAGGNRRGTGRAAGRDGRGAAGRDAGATSTRSRRKSRIPRRPPTRRC